MTAEEWEKASKTPSMLSFLVRYYGGVSGRLLRMFATTCAWGIYHDRGVHSFIERVEAAIDSGMHTDFQQFRFESRYVLLSQLACTSSYECAYQFASSPSNPDTDSMIDYKPILDAKSEILRRVFGNPLIVLQCRQTNHLLGSDPVSVDCDCRWFDGEPHKIATAVYAERDPRTGFMDRIGLLTLADALEEAGCCATRLLITLRAPGNYCRGFWPVDTVLKKRIDQRHHCTEE